MLATGVRVVRGPDWVWENQGNWFGQCVSLFGAMPVGDKDYDIRWLCG